MKFNCFIVISGFLFLMLICKGILYVQESQSERNLHITSVEEGMDYGVVSQLIH